MKGNRPPHNPRLLVQPSNLPHYVLDLNPIPLSYERFATMFILHSIPLALLIINKWKGLQGDLGTKDIDAYLTGSEVVG